MIELYLLIGLILAIGSVLVCKKKSASSYCMIFLVIVLVWPAVAIAAFLRA